MFISLLFVFSVSVMYVFLLSFFLFFLCFFFFVCCYKLFFFFFFSSRRRHTRCLSDWSSDVCSSDLCKLVLRFLLQYRAHFSDIPLEKKSGILTPYRDLRRCETMWRFLLRHGLSAS